MESGGTQRLHNWVDTSGRRRRSGKRFDGLGPTSVHKCASELGFDRRKEVTVVFCFVFLHGRLLEATLMLEGRRGRGTQAREERRGRRGKRTYTWELHRMHEEIITKKRRIYIKLTRMGQKTKGQRRDLKEDV